MAILTTSSKGQVVIPKKERDKIGIAPGAKVLVEAVGDHIEIRPLPENPIDYLCGIFSDYPGSLTEALLKERREERKREEKKFA
ncbi:MAG: AbrB/MazE/SpoVT family DNA-binding domain-containing protein [Nitrospirae bacterium]|nr:AbrB/MazE/SpoVT family DNA-binding domain-containing protein [Nitrospirota bacterium]